MISPKMSSMLRNELNFEIGMSEKKGLRSYMARTFNVYQWAGAKALVASGNSIRNLFTEMTVVKKDVRKETFAQAVVRLGLTAKDVQDREKQYRLTSSVFGLFFLFGVVYSVLLYLREDYLTSLMAVAYTMLMFAFFFRESFWYMQVKKRELGKSLKDWVFFLVGQ